MLSVSGARGIVGESMTSEVAGRFAAAFGSVVADSATGRKPVLCLGRDTRASSGLLSRAAGAGLASAGAHVIDLGIVPTPTVGVMVTERQADGGLVITASHNPPEWNGLKCITAEGHAPAPADVDEIIRRFNAGDVISPADAAAGAEDSTGIDVHVGRILAHLDAEAIRAAALEVVFDPNHGAGARAGLRLLHSLGCDVIELNTADDGRFAHGLEPTQANLEQLSRHTAAGGADIGFGVDADADRLAMVDEHGRYIGEEYTLVLASQRILDLQGPTPLVANLSTSRMIDDLAARYPGTVVHRTPVGESHVVGVMKRHNAVIGGEGNGGVVFRPVSWIRDSLSAMTLVLGLVAASRKPLSEVVGGLPAYIMIKDRVELDDTNRDASTAAAGRLRKRFADARLNTTDGVRLDLEDGWVHVRPSNTEPIVRLIAEATTRERARELLDEVAAAVGLRKD